MSINSMTFKKPRFEFVHPADDMAGQSAVKEISAKIEYEKKWLKDYHSEQRLSMIF